MPTGWRDELIASLAKAKLEGQYVEFTSDYARWRVQDVLPDGFTACLLNVRYGKPLHTAVTWGTTPTSRAWADFLGRRFWVTGDWPNNTIEPCRCLPNS